MNIRLAKEEDMDVLIQMRWDFTLEHQPEVIGDFELFAQECREFLVQAILGGRWYILGCGSGREYRFACIHPIDR